MKTNMLILVIPSLLAFISICLHIIKIRGTKFLLWFIGSGLVFGFLRARLIHFIQVTINNSEIPYEFAGKLLKIGNDSLIVYLGWIIVSYLAWQLAEIIIKKIDSKKSGELFPVISFSFFIIAALSYLNETAASVAGWWSWNSFLESGFKYGLAYNVPLVGLIDWATVAFEFLAIFLIIRSIKKKSDLKYLLVILLPIMHWASHINFRPIFFNNFPITPSLVVHSLLPLIAVLLWIIKEPKIDRPNSQISDKYIWASFGIIISVCVFAILFYGKKVELLVSVVPIVIFILMATVKNFKKALYLFGIGIAGLSLFISTELTGKRIIFSLFPVLFLAFLDIFKKIDTKKVKKYLLFFAIFILIIPLMLIPKKETKNNSSSIFNIKKGKVILITIDTVSAEHVGAYGSKNNTTPNFDNFAKENITFTDAYSPVPYTYPAHYSIFSGLYPKSTKITSNALKINLLNNNQELIAEKFQKNGFSTAAFVASQVLVSSEIKRGFDFFDKGEIGLTEKNSDKLIIRRNAEKVNDSALKWIKEQDDKNYFAWVHYYDAHSPYAKDCEFNQFSKDLEYDNKNVLTGDVGGILKNSNDLTEKDIRYLSAKYDDGIFCLDRELGNFLEGLKNEKDYNDITIIIASDHGENFDHGSIFHGTNIYQSAIKIPLAIKTDDNKKDVLSHHVILTDIYQTLIDKFKLYDIASKSEGENLFFNNNERNLFFQTSKIESITPDQIQANNPNFVGIISPEKKKMIYSLTDKKTEYYNLLEDSHEINNIQNVSQIFFSNLKEFFEIR